MQRSNHHFLDNTKVSQFCPSTHFIFFKLFWTSIFNHSNCKQILCFHRQVQKPTAANQFLAGERFAERSARARIFTVLFARLRHRGFLESARVIFFYANWKRPVSCRTHQFECAYKYYCSKKIIVIVNFFTRIRLIDYWMGCFTILIWFLVLSHYGKYYWRCWITIFFKHLCVVSANLTLYV